MLHSVTKAILLVLGVFLFPVYLYAADASFYLSPETGVYTIGEEFPVSIMINTDGADITAAGGKLSFNKEGEEQQLEVVSISKEGSLFTSWIEPVAGFDLESVNKNGIISFEGFISGGYKGSGGHVMTITFKALRDISSKIKFQTGSAILAADKKATNILAQMNSGVYTLNAEEVVPILEYVAPVNTDSLNITSTTHPDQEKWYATTTANFSWNLGDDVKSLRLLFNNQPNSIPTIFYKDPITEKTIEDIEEGIWYLHIQINNTVGWGDVAHFKVQIDVADPEYFEIEQIERKDISDPKPVFVLDAFDAVSGIFGYEISVDGVSVDIVESSTDASSTKTVYQIEKVVPGSHVMVVNAIDGAGNSIENKVSFVVGAISTPKITKYKTKTITGNALAIGGEALESSEVKIFMSKDGADAVQSGVLSDSVGNFTYVIEEITEPGSYEFWAQTKNIYGAESDMSEKIKIFISKPGIEVYGGIIVGYLSIITPLIGLVVLLFVSLWWGWHKFGVYKKKLKKEVGEAEDALNKEFKELKKITSREISSLERARSYRKLTPEEHSIIKRFKGSVTESEKNIKKEFIDVIKVADNEEIVEEQKQEERVENKSQKSKEKEQGKMQLRIEKLH